LSFQLDFEDEDLSTEEQNDEEQEDSDDESQSDFADALESLNISDETPVVAAIAP
jgi:hypothetical protein